MTTIISSQRYIDNEILNAKIAQIETDMPAEIVLTAWDVDGEFAILSDGHHTFEAASQCNVQVRFEIVTHPEGLTGNDLLEQAWMDSDWYDVETGNLAF